MPNFSTIYGINKPQAALDFVDIDPEVDTPLHIDPNALTSRNDSWSITCLNQVNTFFQAVITTIRDNDKNKCLQLLSHLGEPEETHLGFSKGSNKGRGVGPKQAEDIFNALKKTKAAATGLLKDLSDLALFIPKLGRDKVSDMTTNIIRHNLIIYTQQQCNLYNIKIEEVSSGMYWCTNGMLWKQKYTNLPVYNGEKILLVPKYTVRYQVGVDHTDFRKKFVLDFLQEENLKSGSSLVKAIKNAEGEVVNKVVYKKDLDEHYPKEKSFLAEFATQNPEVIDKYRGYLNEKASAIPDINGDEYKESLLAKEMKNDLISIPTGSADADIYHNHCISLISFIFFPFLIYPRKEHEINEGRKRIDLIYTNAKVDGFFYRMSLDQEIKANTIHIECKNYTNDIKNPELDQLLARFDRHRGKLGILLFRRSNDITKLKARCRDAVKQGIGIALPIDDDFLIKCLGLIEKGKRENVDKLLNILYQEITS